MNKIGILGTGSYTPDNLVTNEDLCSKLDSNDEWIRTRTGIETRYLTKTENTSDLAYEAALLAIKDAGINKNDIGLIICATMTPDNIFPSSSVMIAGKLGLEHIMAFDLSAACSGFLYSIDVAFKMHRDPSKYTLVVGSEVMSKILDFTDRNTCILFGDGAGAAIIGKSDKSEIIDVFSKSILDDENLVSGSFPLKSHLSESLNIAPFMYMNGREIFKFATTIINSSIRKLCVDNGIKVSDIKFIVPHQANSRIFEKAAKMLKVDPNILYSNIKEYGNTSSAGVAIALDEVLKKGLIKKDDYYVMVAFGAGLTYSAVLIKY